MQEAYGFNEPAMREVLHRLDEHDKTYDMIRRRLATFSVRRHEAVYIPGKSVVLAKFIEHVSPATPYSYPARDGYHRKFPAYIWRNVTYNNDPTSVGYTINEPLATPASPFAEPVFVYNIRNWWIPEHRLHWAWELNGRWYTDYVKPAGPLEYWGSFSASSAGSEDLIPTSAATIDYGYDGHGLTVNASTGVVTVHRAMRVTFTANMDVTLSGTATGTLTAWITHPGSSACQGAAVWQVDDASGSQRHCSIQGCIDGLDIGNTFKFSGQFDPGSESFSGNFSVTLDSQSDY